ncbi:MAG: hypothetical protein ACOYY2_03050 [Actinomycetota bacterium]
MTGAIAVTDLAPGARVRRHAGDTTRTVAAVGPGQAACCLAVTFTDGTSVNVGRQATWLTEERP